MKHTLHRLFHRSVKLLSIIWIISFLYSLIQFCRHGGQYGCNYLVLIIPCILSTALYIIRNRRLPHSFFSWGAWIAYPMPTILLLIFLHAVIIKLITGLPFVPTLFLCGVSIGMIGVAYIIFNQFLLIALLILYYTYYRHLPDTAAPAEEDIKNQRLPQAESVEEES